MALAVFLVVLTAAGLVGAWLLCLVGLDAGEAGVGGRVLGLVVAVWPAWWWGSLGLPGWPVVAAVTLVLGAAAGLLYFWRRRAWRAMVAGEAVFWAATLAVLALRLGRAAIVDTEKPMDLGILATLLRTPDFPPADMWLAGHTLPYYYWGALTWAAPIRLAGLPVELAYNLVVALVAGLAAALAWRLGARLAGGSRAAGATAAFFAVFAGTPDGLRQVLLGGRDPRFTDLWSSSRQVTSTITEYPLFTVWLGDLHPHYLSLPLALAAVLVALHLGRSGPTRGGLAVVALLAGAAWAANPWAMPPTLAAVGLAVLAGGGGWVWPWAGGWRVWAGLAAMAMLAWLAFAPFHLDFAPPYHGLGLVRAWTAPHELLLYAGCLLVAPIAVAVRRLGSGAGEAAGPARLARVLLPLAAVVVVAVTVQRITLVALAALLVATVLAVLAAGADELRPALALAALGAFLLAVPELVFVVDAYGDELHRMNTVFKAYIQAWPLLAVTLPALLAAALPTRRARQAVLFVLVVAASPHLVTAAWGSLGAGERGLDGMAWMSPGDRALVAALRAAPVGSVLLEATGGAYSRYGRLAAASGVPCLLGWANHELVWRGGDIVSETTRRGEVVAAIFGAGEAATVRALAAEDGITHIAVGDLERQDFAARGLAAVRAAGTVVAEHGDNFLVRLGDGTGASP